MTANPSISQPRLKTKLHTLPLPPPKYSLGFSGLGFRVYYTQNTLGVGGGGPGKTLQLKRLNLNPPKPQSSVLSPETQTFNPIA